MIKADDMIALVDACLRETQTIIPANEFSSLGNKTRLEYCQLGQLLLNRARNAEGGVAEVLSATRRPTTFYKRLAALRYYLCANLVESMGNLQAVLSARPVDRLQLRSIYAQLQLQRTWLRQFEEVRHNGHTGERRKRVGKRQSLRGLPDDWREQLYARAANGKYAEAILVAALTGCRPEELRRGVIIRREYDPANALDYIRFEIDGAKVKEHQGQPHRSISYLVTDSHSLVVSLQARLAEARELLVRIDSPANFTVEVRRLAASLWPKHKHSITAYCLRHQWSADLKASYSDGDMVSMGLGHCSAKTRRYYGVASQSGTSGQLHPYSIDAERPVKSIDVAPHAAYK